MHTCPADEAAAAVEKRLQELYGTIALEWASLKVVRSGKDVSIFRCALGSEQKVLVAIALASTPMTSLDMSSSARRLKGRVAAKVNTALLTKKSWG